MESRAGEGADMTACPVILQVFFDSAALDAVVPLFDHDKDYHGLPYWQAPDGKGKVYRWSFDMVTCGDERWVVFGPFDDRGQALAMLFTTFTLDSIFGYRIINEHCAAYCGALGKCYGRNGTKWEFYREAWTDG